MHRPVVSIFGAGVPVEAEIVEVAAFSSQADQGEPLEWPSACKKALRPRHGPYVGAFYDV